MSLLPSGVVQVPGKPYFAIAQNATDNVQFQYSTSVSYLSTGVNAYLPTQLSTTTGKTYLFNGVLLVSPHSGGPILSTNTGILDYVISPLNGASEGEFAQNYIYSGVLGQAAYQATQTGVLYKAKQNDSLVAQVLKNIGPTGIPAGAIYDCQMIDMTLTQLN